MKKKAHSQKESRMYPWFCGLKRYLLHLIRGKTNRRYYLMRRFTACLISMIE